MLARLHGNRMGQKYRVVVYLLALIVAFGALSSLNSETPDDDQIPVGMAPVVAVVTPPLLVLHASFAEAAAESAPHPAVPLFLWTHSFLI